MTLFIGGAIALLFLAGAFVAWPLVASNRHANALMPQERQQANVDLFREHLAELEANCERGAVGESEFEVLKRELELSLLADSEAQAVPSPQASTNVVGGRILLALALTLPLGAAALYWDRGASANWQIKELQAAKHAEQALAFQEGRRPDRAPSRALAAALQARLAKAPEDQHNWYLLARTAMELEDYAGAVAAYKQVLNREPSAGRVLGELAQALFIAGNNRITPEIENLLQRALVATPKDPTTLGLAGVAAFEAANYREAIDYWRQVLQLTGMQGAGAQSLLSGIARAKRELEEAGEAVSEPTGDTAPNLTLRVSLGEGVPQQPGQVVFVYARAWQGAKMPLAIQRLRVEDLPQQVTLDESMAMAPGMTIASVAQLELVARLSQDGGAVPKSGDWLTTLGPLTLGEQDAALNLQIDTPVP